MCIQTEYRYRCNHSVFSIRERCWGDFWSRWHYFDCIYSCLSWTGGMTPGCEIKPELAVMNMKCADCREKDIELQRVQATQARATTFQPILSLSGTGTQGFQGQQGMKDPQAPAPAHISSKQKTVPPSPAPRESQFDRQWSQSLGTRVLSPEREPSSRSSRGTERKDGEKRHRSQSASGTEDTRSRQTRDSRHKESSRRREEPSRRQSSDGHHRHHTRRTDEDRSRPPVTDRGRHRTKTHRSHSTRGTDDTRSRRSREGHHEKSSRKREESKSRHSRDHHHEKSSRRREESKSRHSRDHHHEKRHRESKSSAQHSAPASSTLYMADPTPRPDMVSPLNASDLAAPTVSIPRHDEYAHYS